MVKQKGFFGVLLFILVPITVLFMASCQFEASSVDASKAARMSEHNGIENGYFSNNRVLIVLNREASKSLKTYTPEDFPGFRFNHVEDFTRLTMEVVRKQLEAEKTGDWSGLKEHVENSMLVNVDNFRRILGLVLPEEDRSRENVLRAIALLKNREDIAYAGPDYFHEPCAAPSPQPAYYGQQLPWLNAVSLPGAWNLTTGSPTIKVAVMDCGIEVGHPALEFRLDTGASRDFSTGITNGMPYGHSSGFSDFYGHGTMVAGIIGSDYMYGNITGVCWNIKLVSLQVFSGGDLLYSSSPNMDTSTSLLNAIDYVTSAAIPIANYSGHLIGYDHGRGNHNFEPPCYIAIRNYPGLFVCAAGNSGRYIGTNPNFPDFFIYPAAYDLPNLVSVGALNSNFTGRWKDLGPFGNGSNYSKEYVDIFAPGEDILTTFPMGMCIKRTCSMGGVHVANGYHKITGTSFAAPFVSGVAALLKSRNPSLTAPELKTLIVNNSDFYGPLADLCVSGGRLNALAAVENSRHVGSSIDVSFNGMGTIGKFYLFNNTGWSFVGKEEVVTTAPLSQNLASYPFAQYLQMGPLSADMLFFFQRYSTHYGKQVSINTPVNVLVPTHNQTNGVHYAKIQVNIGVSATGITITDGNSIERIGITGAYGQRTVTIESLHGRLEP